MSEQSNIEWTDATLNVFTGCTKVSPGCDHCYISRTMPFRVAGRQFDAKGHIPLVFHEDRLDLPMSWRKPKMVFVNSLSDMFHKDVPFELIDKMFAMMAVARKHTFQILTKRPNNALAYFKSRPEFQDVIERMLREYDAGAYRDKPPKWLQILQGTYRVTEAWALDGTDSRFRLPKAWPLPNVWLGVTAENQEWAEKRIPVLLKIPAAVRFLSCEPLLGPIDLQSICKKHCPQCHGAGEVQNSEEGGIWMGCPCERLCGLGWCIVGGESGHEARPMHPIWARGLRDQCNSSGVAFHFKQWGEYLPAEVYDDPNFSGGRAFENPMGGISSATIRIKAPPGNHFEGGSNRLMMPGDKTSHYQMLDIDTIAVKVGKHAAGRVLDGRTWDEFPKRS